MTLDELRSVAPAWSLPAAAIAFGLVWGSFLNVVIHRVPREMSVVRPASHCPACGKPIAGYDNVPVLSYVILRGRARCCGARMSPRYPLVELLGGALSLAILELIVLKLPGTEPAARALAIYGADFALALALVAAAFIDAEHMFLPDTITYGGMVLGVGTASFRDVVELGGTRAMHMGDAAMGALIGFLVIWLPFTFLYKGLLGRTGMGLGDAKLVALAGAWFGWKGALFALFAGALQGTPYTLALRVLGVKPKLPDAVVADLEELKKAAEAGDEEARRELEADPLAEDEDPFLIRLFVTKILRREWRPKEEPEEATGAADDPPPEPRARIPFGPFLILGILELLFFSDVLLTRVTAFFTHGLALD
jgi:leader peptidase (prepilin peptidase)/N-methyltransferase